MFSPVSPVHRIARINYGPRALAFAYIFLVIALLISERGGSPWVIAFAVLQFIVYPHLAYLHTRLAADSKQAEMRNLLADALLLGAWAAQMHFPLWTTCGLLLGPSLVNSAHGGLKRLALALLLFAAGALIWASAVGFAFHPETDLVVSGLSALGIVGYASWIGILVHEQNRHLLRTRSALKNTEDQFRFIAEHEGELVSVLDAGGNFRYASPAHARYVSAEACAPGRAWIDLVHDEDRLQARLFVNLLASNKSRERIQLRMFPVNGRWHILECRGNPVIDEEGHTQMIVLVSRDVAARLQADIDYQLNRSQSAGPENPGS